MEAVIFDLDDTLIDWAKPDITWDEFARPKTENVRAHLIANGHDLPSANNFYSIVDQAMTDTWEEAKKTWHIPSIGTMLTQVLINLGVDTSQIDMNKILRIYDWGPVPGVVLYPDTLNVLTTLRDQGYKIGLLTNSFLPMWMRDIELEAYQLIDFLDARLSAADIGILKPHPAIYHSLLDLLDTSPERVVFVGDRPANDIAGANEVGCVSVLIDPPHLNRDLEDNIPDFTITCLNQLLSIMSELEVVRE